MYFQLGGVCFLNRCIILLLSNGRRLFLKNWRSVLETCVSIVRLFASCGSKYDTKTWNLSHRSHIDFGVISIYNIFEKATTMNCRFMAHITSEFLTHGKFFQTICVIQAEIYSFHCIAFSTNNSQFEHKNSRYRNLRFGVYFHGYRKCVHLLRIVFLINHYLKKNFGTL